MYSRSYSSFSIYVVLSLKEGKVEFWVKDKRSFLRLELDEPLKKTPRYIVWRERFPSLPCPTPVVKCFALL